MIYTLLTNLSGTLSACPTLAAYAAGGYYNNPALVRTFNVTMSEALNADLYANRERAVVIGPGLPLTRIDQITDPSMAYYQITISSELIAVKVPEEVRLAYAKAQKIAELTMAFTQAKQGRFESAALWYDGRDFLLFAMAFVMSGEDGDFACAHSAVGPFIMMERTVAEMKKAGDDFQVWYRGLQTRFYGKQAEVFSATTFEQISAVSW